MTEPPSSPKKSLQETVPAHAGISDLESRIKVLREKFDSIGRTEPSAAHKPSRYGTKDGPDDFVAGGGYATGIVKVTRPPALKPAKISDEERLANKAISDTQARLDMVARLGQGGVEIETCRIELDAAKEAMAKMEHKRAREIAEHVLHAMDERFLSMLQENTSKELAHAYSLISGARTLGLEVGRQTKLVEEAQSAFLSDDLPAANRIINDIVQTITDTRRNFLKRETERLLGSVFEILEVVSVMESELGELRSIFDKAQGLYRRESLEDAYRLSDQANELAKNLKDLYFQRYCLQALSDLRAKMTIAGSFRIDTVMHKDLLGQLERQSLSKANITKMREVAQQVEEAKSLLEGQITAKLKVSAMEDLKQIEEDCARAMELNIFTRRDQERLGRLRTALMRQDFMEFEALKGEFGRQLKASVQKARQRNSRDALSLVSEVRRLLKEAEDQKLDVGDAKKRFEEARGLVPKGDYKNMVRLCNKAKNIIVVRMISRNGQTPVLERMMMESDERSVRKKRLQDIGDVLVNLRESHLDVGRIERLLKEAQAVLEKGDLDSTDNHLVEIEADLGDLGNEVWINQAMSNLQRAAGSLKPADGAGREKERLSALYNKSLKHIESNEFLDAIWTLKEI